MEDWLLIRIGLCISLLGIVSLFLICQNSEIPENSINQIDDINNPDGDLDYVLISGNVVNVKNTEKATILEISSQQTIPVIVFENVSIKSGDDIMLEGRTREYDGKREIIADMIRIRKKG